jgi:Spy/CpxP family protein refolding chaperone
MEGYEMKKIFMLVVMTLLLAAVPSMAQNPSYGSYGMGPGMMGGYGGHGYGMGPGMMGGYGGHGYGMGPGMMGGYGGHGACPNCGAYQGQQFKSKEDYSKFLDDTKEHRKKLHDMVFEYNEEMRSPDPDRAKLSKMGKEIYELRNEIFNYKSK